MLFLQNRTNEELARIALDALHVLESRGNKVGQASREVARFLNHLLELLKERADLIEIELTPEVSITEIEEGIE